MYPEKVNLKAGYWLPGAGGGVEWGELLNGSRISFLGDRNVWNWTEMLVAQYCECN